MNKSFSESDIEIPSAAFQNAVVRRGGVPAWEDVPAPARDAARLSLYTAPPPTQAVLPLAPDLRAAFPTPPKSEI